MAKRDSIIQRNIAFMYGRNAETEKMDPDKRMLVKSKPKFLDSDAITNFSGENSFLAPSHPCKVILADEMDNPYPSFEHALQASKLLDYALRDSIRKTSGIREIKRIASKPSREGWKEDALLIAENLLRDKFVRNKELRLKLIETKTCSLVFKNDYGDLYWGVGADGKGQNNLGKLLERIRRDAQSQQDAEKWIQSLFKVQSNEVVDISVEVKKGDDIMNADCKTFEKKSFVSIGKSDECDVVAVHPSISRVHAKFLVDKQRGGVIVDLGSSNGTWVDRELIPAFGCVVLTAASLVRFGSSGRTYRLMFDLNAEERRKAQLYEKLSNPNVLVDEDEEMERTIFVRNIDPVATDYDVESFFAQCGPIQKFSVPRHRVSRKAKGIAFVTFKTLSGIVQALSRDKDDFLGQEIRIKKNSFKPAAGSSVDTAGGCSGRGDSVGGGRGSVGHYGSDRATSGDDRILSRSIRHVENKDNVDRRNAVIEDAGVRRSAVQDNRPADIGDRDMQTGTHSNDRLGDVASTEQRRRARSDSRERRPGRSASPAFRRERSCSPTHKRNRQENSRSSSSGSSSSSSSDSSGCDSSGSSSDSSSESDTSRSSGHGKRRRGTTSNSRDMVRRAETAQCSSDNGSSGTRPAR